MADISSKIVKNNMNDINSKTVETGNKLKLTKKDLRDVYRLY